MVDLFSNVYDVPDQTTVTRWCRTGVLNQGEDFFILPSADRGRSIVLLKNSLIGW